MIILITALLAYAQVPEELREKPKLDKEQRQALQEIVADLPAIPEQDRHWCETPTILVCKNNLSYTKMGVDSIVLLLQVDAKIKFQNCDTTCNAQLGTITVDGPLCFKDFNTDERYSGLTIAKKEEDNPCIQWSRIELWQTDLRTLAHELGHAYGYDHSKKKQHLMYPSSTYNGWELHGMIN